MGGDEKDFAVWRARAKIFFSFIAGGKSMQKYVGPEYGCCIIYVYP